MKKSIVFSLIVMMYSVWVEAQIPYSRGVKQSMIIAEWEKPFIQTEQWEKVNPGSSVFILNGRFLTEDSLLVGLEYRDNMHWAFGVNITYRL